MNSPKVTNGSKDFRLTQVELASKSDELYNKLINKAVQKDIHPPAVKSQVDNNLDQYIDLSQHADEEKFPKDDIVILQPKNSLALPLLQNRHFPVTNHDVKNFRSIVELAYTKGVQKRCQKLHLLCVNSNNFGFLIMQLPFFLLGHNVLSSLRLTVASYPWGNLYRGKTTSTTS